MAEMKWFRFYSETLADRKIQRVCAMTGQPKAIVIGLWTIILSIASESPTRGKLLLAENIPITINEILYEAGLSDQIIIDAFIQLGILAQDGDTLSVVSWEKRQYENDSSTARTRQYRERKRTEAETSQERHKNVTVTPSDTESDTDTESDDAAAPKSQKLPSLTALTTNYTDSISSTINPVIADEFKEYAAKVEPLWVANAFKVAAKNDALRWPYIRAILDSCITAGRWVDRGKGNGKTSINHPPLHVGTVVTPEMKAARDSLDKLFNAKRLESADR